MLILGDNMELMHIIKEKMRSFLPASSKATHRRMDTLEHQLDNVLCDVRNILSELESLNSMYLNIQKDVGLLSYKTLENQNTLKTINDKTDRTFHKAVSADESLKSIVPLREVVPTHLLTYENLQRVILEEITQITRVSLSNKTLSDSVLKEIQNIRRDYRTYYWNNTYEKKAITNNYGNIVEDNDFEGKYLSLIEGLDDESINVVNRIIWCQNQYLSCKEESMDLFTLEEQIELHKIEDVFLKEVIKISDNLYAYGRYLLPVNHFEPVVFYYKYCLKDISNLERIKGKTIIDGGAFIGDTALILSELKPKKIVSFEPIQENFELCKETISINKINNVLVENKALGAHSGRVSMYSAGEGSTCYPREEDREYYSSTQDVLMITLDEYVKENELDIGLIKLDIEGSEKDCLVGARSVISEQRPTLLICIYHNKNDFFEIKTMLEKWDLDYCFKIRKPTVNNATYETLLIAEPYDSVQA